MQYRNRLLVLAAALSVISEFSAQPAGSQVSPLPESKPGKAEPVLPKISTEATPEQDRAIERRLEQIFSELEGAEGVRVDVRSSIVTLSGEVLSQTAREQAVKLARQVGRCGSERQDNAPA